VTIVDTDPATTIDGPETVSTVLDVMSGVEGIVVATPSSTHAEVIESLLGFDVPIFVEKPLTTDVDSAARIARLAPGSVFVMDKWRYHPAVTTIRDLVTAGRLGRISVIETTRVQHGMPHTDVDCSWILLPHDLAIAFEITGHHADALRATGRLEGGQIVGCDAEFSLGEDIIMRSSFGIDAAESLRTVRVIGDRAMATLGDGWSDHIVITELDDDSIEETIETPGRLPLEAELADFIDHLAGGPPPRSSVIDGATAVATIIEVRRLAGAT
jgi:predicted dehydrogenase